MIALDLERVGLQLADHSSKIAVFGVDKPLPMKTGDRVLPRKTASGGLAPESLPIVGSLVGRTGRTGSLDKVAFAAGAIRVRYDRPSVVEVFPNVRAYAQFNWQGRLIISLSIPAKSAATGGIPTPWDKDASSSDGTITVPPSVFINPRLSNFLIIHLYSLDTFRPQIELNPGGRRQLDGQCSTAIYHQFILAGRQPSNSQIEMVGGAIRKRQGSQLVIQFYADLPSLKLNDLTSTPSTPTAMFLLKSIKALPNCAEARSRR